MAGYRTNQFRVIFRWTNGLTRNIESSFAVKEYYV
jgi:hypothetical protein